MPHSTSWDETAPLGSAAASTIDDIIRELKVSIRERADDFVSDWANDDPVTLKPEVLNRTARQVIWGPFSVPFNNNNVAYVGTGAGEGAIAIGVAAKIDLPFEKNWKITKIEILGKQVGGSNCTVELHKTTFDASVNDSVEASTSITSATVVVTELFNGTETINGTAYYWLYLDASAGDFYLYGVRVTYDEVFA